MAVYHSRYHRLEIVSRKGRRQEIYFEAIPIMLTDRVLKQIARELALQRSVIHLLPSWCDECGLEREGSARLEGFLLAHTKYLAKQLAGSSLKIESPSLEETMRFAIDALPQWVEAGHLAAHVAASLNRGLKRKL